MEQKIYLNHQDEWYFYHNDLSRYVSGLLYWLKSFLLNNKIYTCILISKIFF